MSSMGGPILRIRNARLFETASDAAQVSNRQIHIALNGEREKTEYLRGGGVKIADSRASFREFVHPPPYSAQHNFTSTNTYRLQR